MFMLVWHTCHRQTKHMLCEAEGRVPGCARASSYRAGVGNPNQTSGGESLRSGRTSVRWTLFRRPQAPPEALAT